MTGPGLRERIAGWLSHDTHPAVQFVKYVATGGLATLTFLAVQWAAETLWFPIDPKASGAVSLPYVYAGVTAFMASICLVYPLNRMFVFRPGRHSQVMEFLYFTGLAAIGSALGILLGAVLVPMGVWLPLAKLTTVFTSAMVNYAGRKFFVFKG